MKLSNGEIFAAFSALKELSEINLPVKVSFGLAKIVNGLAQHQAPIEKVNNSLIMKYGEPDKDNSNSVSVHQTSDKYPAFLTDVNELMNTMIEIDDFDKIKLPDTVDGKPLEVSAKILIPLSSFVELA